MKCEAKTEKEMRDTKVPWPKTQGELSEYISSLLNRDHDYGTCVYAMSMAAEATFNYVSHVLGVTGFQASCADMDFIRRTRGWENFSVVNYEDLLYPQYEHKFSKTLSARLWKNIQDEAKKRLRDNGACESVRNHWGKIADGRVPFGFSVEPDKS